MQQANNPNLRRKGFRPASPYACAHGHAHGFQGGGFKFVDLEALQDQRTDALMQLAERLVQRTEFPVQARRAGTTGWPVPGGAVDERTAFRAGGFRLPTAPESQHRGVGSSPSSRPGTTSSRPGTTPLSTSASLGMLERSAAGRSEFSRPASRGGDGLLSRPVSRGGDGLLSRPVSRAEIHRLPASPDRQGLLVTTSYSPPAAAAGLGGSPVGGSPVAGRPGRLARGRPGRRSSPLSQMPAARWVSPHGAKKTAGARAAVEMRSANVASVATAAGAATNTSGADPRGAPLRTCVFHTGDE